MAIKMIVKQPVKNIAPLIYLVTITVFWSWYYRSNHILNDYGQAKFEWLFMLDALLVLPVLCWFCVTDKKAAVIKAMVYVGLAIFIGSFVIPAEHKVIWPYLENGRYVMLAMLLLFEVTVIVTVYWAIRGGLNANADPDQAISMPIRKWLGTGVVAKLMCFEARMWSFLIFNQRIKEQNYPGDVHFSYHQKDGAQSNALGFIWLVVFEIPLVHLLLHFVWSPLAANVVTGLTLFGLCFMVAEYRAMNRRPISILNDQLIIRMGLLNEYIVDLTVIESVDKHCDYVPRSKSIKRFNLAANPNVCLQLKKTEKGVNRIYLGVDQPVAFIDAIKNSIKCQTK